MESLQEQVNVRVNELQAALQLSIIIRNCKLVQMVWRVQFIIIIIVIASSSPRSNSLNTSLGD